MSELSLHVAQGAAFKPWILEHDTLNDRETQHLRKLIGDMVNPPLISILMPTYNSAEVWLKAAIASIQAQIYPHWELCIADDASTATHVRPILEQLACEDSRIRVLFRDQNGHISAASNDALSLAKGEFIALMDHDDLLPSHALTLLALAIAEYPDSDLLYSDEDKIDLSGERFGPYFKPNWNPDLLRCQNMVSHFGVFRREVVCRLGGFRVGFEGSQDWDLALRVSEATTTAHIHHLPFILYHWRTVPGSTSTGINAKSYVEKAGCKAVQEHLDRISLKAEVLPYRNGQFRIRYALPSTPPTISLIVELQGMAAGMAFVRNLPSWLDRAGITVAEIVVSEIREGILPTTIPPAPLSKAAPAPTSTGRRQQAADHAIGDVLVFISPFLEAYEDDWLAELVSHAWRPETGAVGAKLIGNKGKLIGGGYILGLNSGVGTHHGGIGKGDSGYMGRGQLQQNLSAVSGDCLAIRRDRFQTVGGFNAMDFPTMWADIDLCLRLCQIGFWNVWNPHSSLRYTAPHESQMQELPEEIVLKQRWTSFFSQDPAYNPNLSLAWDQPVVGTPRHSLPWRSTTEL